MISAALQIIAVILFLIAGCDGTLFDQGPGDLVAFGLAFYVAGVLLSPFGPPVPTRSS